MSKVDKFVKKQNSLRRTARLNRRQRKKLYLGEFQEQIFEIRVRFHQVLSERSYDRFLDEFIAFIESRKLLVAGLGGCLPLSEIDGVISVNGRGSPVSADRLAVVDWLRAYPDIAEAEAGEFVDAWYGWK
jgi:uncharacterized protein YggL (DUF469 family)